jgi:Tol biopolymer transport system component/tRNA A-37 threonylcarbamoyl transferase component Bud32
MPLTPGTRLATYEILSPLGTGGMGEVYRARDPKLGREVAIKVLPAESLHDDTARARLMREARLAATLNHPNICTVHEVGEADGHIYLAMELIDGLPLREKIAGRGAGLPTESVARYGAQIATALTHAHDRHVIHRDLKSSNVVVTADGRVKVLDFGTARRALESPEAGDATLSTALTATGAIVGTPHYLAPEVLRGEQADERSDLWALGVMLHEMASGSLPFNGTTSFELASAIMNDIPARLPNRVPTGLKTVIGRCLAKEPGERYARASEVRVALETVLSGESATPAARAMKATRVLPVAMMVLGLIAAIAAIWHVRRQSPAPRELKQRQVTSNPAGDPVLAGVISPDGKTLAIVDRTGLSLRSIESGESHPMALPAGLAFDYPMAQINWSPDGSRLLVSGHVADGRPGVWALPVAGGRMRKVMDDASFAVHSPDGTHLAYQRRGASGSEIWVCGANGENPIRVTGDDSSGVIPMWATWSPNGKRLAYARCDLKTETVRLESCDLAGRARVFYSPNVGRALHFYTLPSWLPDGRAVFGLTDPPPNQRDMNLWSLRVDPRSGVPSGSPRRVTQWQRLAVVEPTAFSADGKRLTVGVMEYQSDVYEGRMVTGRAQLQDIRRITLDDRMDMAPTWMPDDSTILFCSDRNYTFDIFRQRTSAAAAEPVVTGPGDQYSPHLSPDREWILYAEQNAGDQIPTSTNARIMRIPVGGGPAEKVLDVRGTATFRSPQAAGASPVLCELQGGSVVFTSFDPVRGRGRELSRVQAHVQPRWSLSPDGSAIALQVESQDSLPRIRLLSTKGAPEREIQLDRPVAIADIAYGADGHSWLIVEAGEQWRLLHMDAHGRTTTLTPPQLWMYSAVASPDGKRVAYTSNTGEGNIWLLEDF